MTSCGNCGAPMRIDRDRGLLVCGHCGTEQEAPAVVEHLEIGSETPSRCPFCATPLSQARLEGYPLRCCTSCFGMLVDMSCFTAVIDAARGYEERPLRAPLPRHQTPGDRSLNCPSCGHPMVNHLYGGPGNVVIDTCEACAVNWLDAGELRRIALAPDSPRSAGS